MQINIKEDWEDIPAGSCIEVTEETDIDYTGFWSFRGGTCEITVPKSKCRIPGCDVAVDEVYYRYETIGRVYWGMKVFTVKKIGTGCMCHTPYYVELESVNNDGEAYTTHVSSVDLKNEYAKTEKDAWKKYYSFLTNEIEKHKKIVETLIEARVKVIKEIMKEN